MQPTTLLSPSGLTEEPRVTHQALTLCITRLAEIDTLFSKALQSSLQSGTLNTEGTEHHTRALGIRLQEEEIQFELWLSLSPDQATGRLHHLAIAVRRVGMAARKAYREFETEISSQHERFARVLAKLAGAHFDVASFLQHVLEDRRDISPPELNIESFARGLEGIAGPKPDSDPPASSVTLFIVAIAVILAITIYLIAR